MHIKRTRILAGLPDRVAVELSGPLAGLRWHLAGLGWQISQISRLPAQIADLPAHLTRLCWRIAESTGLRRRGAALRWGFAGLRWRLTVRLQAHAPATQLAELPRRLLGSKRSWIIGGFTSMSIIGVAAATAVATPQEHIAAQRIVERLAVVPEELPAPDLPFVFDDRVAPGDTAQSIFRRLGINDAEAQAFIQDNKETAQALRQLRTGQSFAAVLDTNGRLLSLRLPLSQGEDNYLSVTRGAIDQPFKLTHSSDATREIVTEMRSGVIKHSLFGATEAAGLPDNVAIQLADLFGTEIDFHSDLQRGDTFSVIYETFYDQGAPAHAGRILAAEFINQGKRHTVIRHTLPTGKSEYYSSNGKSLKSSFLRSPLEFSRVTSNFGRRMHPVLKNWRDHRGVDFGAPVGTPVRASSDGVVSFVGNHSGYGNLVVLKHSGNVSTAYAHLSAFAANLRVGDAIEQGQTIGRVGATGRVTGPHLHYEVRVNNVAYDPMTIDLPQTEPLAGKELVRFRNHASTLLAQLALLDYRLASNDISATTRRP
jgi:murein DD-endopeptidase MepM/ murein hydrolase activator NlpD